MERWKGKVAIVSGASSGIGAAITKSLIKEGVHVVGLARNLERFEPLQKELKNEESKLFTLKCDMTNVNDVVVAVKWTIENVGDIHILVNNAGIFNCVTSVLDVSIDQIQNTVNTNLVGAMVLTKEVVNSMVKKQIDGHVIFVNSIAGCQVTNFNGIRINVYPATKFGMKAYADVLRYDLVLDKSKIKVSVTFNSSGFITVGNVRTNISSFHMNPSIKDVSILNPEDCANAVLFMLKTPPNVQIQELIIRPILDSF